MLIVQLYSGQNASTGDFVYRIERPAVGLSALPDLEVLNVDLLNASDKGILLEAALLILHHLSDPDLLPIIRERRRLRKPTIYELADNFRASHEHRSDARRCGPPDYHIIMEEMMRRCDAVQTTGVALRDRYVDLNETFFVFPNLVDDVRKSGGQERRPGMLTVGWGGSARHGADMKRYARPLLDWVSKHPDVRLAIMASKPIQEFFRELSPEQLMLRGPGSLEAYLAFLQELDVGIAPLLPTAFNECRSDVKYLEYASQGVTPVCSRFGPYLKVGEGGKNILLFSNPMELLLALERLRTENGLRQRIAAQAQAWVSRHRLNDPSRWQKRANIYKGLIGDSRLHLGSANVRTKSPPPSEVADVLNPAIHTSDPETSLQELEAALDLWPLDYQVNYFYGWLLSNAGHHEKAVAPLSHALTLRPDSIRTAQLLARVFLINGKVDLALQVTEHALRLEPDLPNLLCLRATIHQVGNRHIEALHDLQRSLERAPSYVDALLALAHSALMLKKVHKVQECLARLLPLIPDSPELEWLTANILLAQSDFSGVRFHLNEALKRDPHHGKSRRLLATLPVLEVCA